MRGEKLILVLIGLMLVLPFTCAGDAAYLYDHEKYVDYNMAAQLFDRGLSVTFIDVADLEEVDLETYDLVLVGDEYLRASKKIDPDVPLVVTGAMNARYIGLAEKYKSLRMTANYPIEIMYEGEMRQIYTDSVFDEYVKTSIPIYLLAGLGGREGFSKMSTSLNGRGDEIGSSIVYIDSGAELFNGKTAEENICFFGIAKSYYWTEEAMNMFNDCIDFVIGDHDVALDSSYGINGIRIVDDETSEEIGEGESLIRGRDYKIYFQVENEGTSTEDVRFFAESCVNWEPADKYELAPGQTSTKYNTINFTCADGSYQIKIRSEIIGHDDEDMSDNEIIREIVIGVPPELVHDVMLDDLKIIDPYGSVVDNGILTSGESYKIQVDLTNIGDYTEDVSFEGEIQDSEGVIVDTFTHVSVFDLEPDETKDDKSRTVLFDFAEGIYKILVRAIIDSDNNPSNNEIEMDVEVV